MIEITLTNILALIVSLFAVVWGYITAMIYFRRRKYAHIPGPETKGIYGFYFGNASEIEKVYMEGKLMEDKLIEWSEMYGPVFKFQMGSQINIYTSDKAAIKDILITKNFQIPIDLFKSFIKPYRIRFLGYGLNTEPNQEKWRHRRNIYNQRFHRNILFSLTHQFNSEGEYLMEKLSNYADGKTPVCLFNMMRRATLDIIAQVAFNLDFDCINNDNEDSFNSIMRETTDISMRHFSDPFAEINPMKIKDRIKFKKLVEVLRNKGREAILNRIKNPDQNNNNDILDSIIEACKNDKEMDIELMIDDFLLFFMAGSETSVSALCTIIYLLEKHPDILKKAQEEIYDLIGVRKEINNEDVIKLKYCSSIIKETLRVNPPFGFGVRYNDASDYEICNYKIPKNSNIWMSTYATSRMESNFKNPLEFNPERFMTDSDSIDSRVDRFAYFPFGLGARNCIGQNFAMIEITVLMVKFLQRFSFKLHQPELFANIHYREAIKDANYIITTI